MPVDPARAALVKEPYSRRRWTAGTAVGDEETIVTALADAAGADAWLARLGGCVSTGLASCVIEIQDSPLPPTIDVGDILLVPPSWPGALAGQRVLVTGMDVRMGEHAVTLTVRGPLP